MQRRIKTLLTEIISDYKTYDIDTANIIYDEVLGTDLYRKEIPYIISSDVLCILSSIMDKEIDSNAFHNKLYSICSSKSIDTKLLHDDEDEFYIHLLDDVS